MNKFKSIVLYLAVFTFCLVMPFSVMANPAILMNGTSSPAAIFDENNILPGDSFVSSISIDNPDNYYYNLATKAASSTDWDGLGEKIYLNIEDDAGIEYFSGKLSDFFALSELDLDRVGAHEKRVFNFNIYFDQATDNQYQTAGVSFDIAIGYEAEAGMKTTGASSIEEQILANQSVEAQNTYKIFEKNKTWQVFASGLSIASTNKISKNTVIDKNFTNIELIWVLFFAISLFVIQGLLKKTRV